MAVHYVESYPSEYEMRPSRHRVLEEVPVKHYYTTTSTHHREYYVPSTESAEYYVRSPAAHTHSSAALVASATPTPSAAHRMSLAAGGVGVASAAIAVNVSNGTSANVAATSSSGGQSGPNGGAAAPTCNHPRCRGALVRCWRHCCPKCGADKSSVQACCESCGLQGHGQGYGSLGTQSVQPQVQVIKEQVQVPMVPVIPESALHRLSTLAQTHHSTLYRCLYDSAPAVEKVIVAETANYHDEATMHSLVDRHPNVVRFYGLCRRSGASPSLVIEQMQHDLQDRLHTLQKDGNLSPSKLIARLLSYLGQVARALRHLHRSGIIHRDISARNMLMEGEVVKLSDFGLAKSVSDKSPSNKPYPLNTAPEALRDLSNPNVWTAKCDVWQFGLLIWEVFSFGRDPLQRFNNSVEQLLAALDADWRPERPNKIPDAAWELALQCIKQDPTFRPNFEDISTQLDHMSKRLRSTDDGF